MYGEGLSPRNPMLPSPGSLGKYHKQLSKLIMIKVGTKSETVKKVFFSGYKDDYALVIQYAIHLHFQGWIACKPRRTKTILKGSFQFESLQCLYHV